MTLKRIRYCPDNFHFKFQEAIKEIFLLKLASYLGTGPQLEKDVYFDLLIYNREIVWPMEMCDTESMIFKHYDDEYQIERVSQKISAELWEALRINHMFNIMHLDIKNDNIAFSPKLNKWIFLDYGMS